MRIHLSSSAIGSSPITALYSRTRRSGILFFVLASLLAGFFGTPSAALAAKLFAVTASDIAGSTDAVYRFEVGPTGTPVLDSTLVDSSLHLPFGIGFSASGELFITNRTGGPPGNGSVSRFVNAGGARVFHGAITDPAFNAPFGAAFRGSELFVSQLDGNNVLRFGFDASGNAVLNPAIPAPLVPPGGAPRGATVNPVTGELFVTRCCGADSAINRYVFDSSGHAVPNGVMSGVGLDNPVDLAFSPWGDLYVTTSSGIARISFLPDSVRTPINRGTLELSGSGITGTLLGLTFSPWGELFVSSIPQSKVFRWTFTDPDHYFPNGSFATPHPVIGIKFEPSPVLITIDASPNELSFSVTGTGCDAGDYVTPRQLSWIPRPAWMPSPDGCTVNFIEGTESTRHVFTPAADWGTNPRHFDVPVVATTYTASSKTQHKLTTSAIPGGAGTVSGNGYHDENSTPVSVTAASSPGYVFKNFDGDLTGGANPQDLAMNAPKNVIGNFAQLSSLTAASATGDYSDAVTLNATLGPPDLVGSGSLQFSVAGTPVGAAIAVSGAGPYTASYVIPFGQGSQLISAAFTSSTPTVENSSDSATLTVSREDATVTPSGSNPAVVNVNPGSTADVTLAASIVEPPQDGAGNISNAVPTVTLSPQAGNCSLTTSGGGVGGTLTATATCNNLPIGTYQVRFEAGGNFYEGSADRSLTVQARHLLTATANPTVGGSVSDGGYYDPGSTANISATANAGYVFVNWTGPVDAPNSATTTVQMNGPKTVTANFQVITTNQPPVIDTDNISGPSDAVAMGANASVTFPFTDPDVGDNHTCTLDWGDGSAPANGNVTVVNGNRLCKGTHAYTQTGIYAVAATVIDSVGASDSEAFEFVTAYDPAAELARGHGSINSPLGAFNADPSKTGKASFGFLAREKQGANALTGQTRLRLRLPKSNFDFSFRGTQYEPPLLTTGNMAQFNGIGTGTLNGVEANYAFSVTAVDVQAPGNDRLRLRITSPDGTNVIYDNIDSNNPATPREILKGKIVIDAKPPTKPNHPSPANNSKGISLKPVFGWNVTGAASYKVTLWRSQDPEPTTPTATVTEPTFTPAGTLAPATEYSWKIEAVNTGGSNTSATWSFTTFGPPENVSPANGKIGVARNANVDWKNTAGAVSYRVCFGASISPTTCTNVSQGNKYDPGQLAANTKYYWNVTAINADGLEQTSDTWSFTTK